MTALSFRSIAVSLLFAAAVGRAAAPVIDPPVPPTPAPARVEAKVPVGKTLLFPITASDADGDPISYRVSSSNPNIMVRAKTGNPKLVLSVSHADGGEDDPPFTGTMEFMLFRDWLPVSAGFVAGFAQAGFYDNVLFHRIDDLGRGQGTTGFIFQGGDPNGTGGGGPGMTAGDPQTAWKFQNEFFNGTLFTGRGQLAMANAGPNLQYSIVGQTLVPPDYRDTNGSQFFITDGQPRHLDFKHNIFGQMLRGWEVLPLMKAVKTTSTRPSKDLKIVSPSVVPCETDTVLVISAKARGSSLITVTATDANGETATATFTVQAVRDETNNNPFLRRVDGVMGPKDQPAVFGLSAVDLEFDYLDIQHSMLLLSAQLGAKGTLLGSSGRVVQMQPNAGYVGPNNVGFSIRQFDIGGGGYGAFSDYTNGYVATGEATARGEGVNISAQPTVALANVVVAKLHDTDPAGVPGDFAAKINWGDGTALSSAVLERDTSRPGATAYVAKGGHTYAKAGIYSVVVDFLGNNGARVSARSFAQVSDAPLRAVGYGMSSNSARIVDRVIATFTDAAPVAPSGYEARIDWGDGMTSAGTIRSDVESGKFVVRGTHGYRDSEPYAVSVRIRKRTDPPENAAYAWSVIEPEFATKTPHLPPFPHPKLTIAWNNGPTKSRTGLPGPNYQVAYKGVFVIINTGNRNLGASKLRYWLSNDRILNKTGANKDVQVKVNGQKELRIIPFPAGAGGSGQFTLTMPKGDSTGRKFLLSEAAYSDPVADDDGTDKVIVTGPLPPTIIVTAASGLETTEAGGTVSFTVVLDTPPQTSTVNIASITAGNPVTINTSGNHGITTGSEIVVAGVTGSTPDINGVRIATAVDADTITIPVEVTTAGTGGTVQVNPRVTVPIETTVPSEGTPSTSVNIASVTTGNPTTFNTATPHGFVTGDTVVISGLVGQVPPLSGTATATVVDEDTFTIAVASTAAGTGGRVQKSKANLVFTAQNWNTPQAVTVTGVDDATFDGTKNYLIQLKAAVSADTLYNGVVGGDVPVKNKDDETAPAP